VRRGTSPVDGLPYFEVATRSARSACWRARASVASARSPVRLRHLAEREDSTKE